MSTDDIGAVGKFAIPLRSTEDAFSTPIYKRSWTRAELLALFPEEPIEILDIGRSVPKAGNHEYFQLRKQNLLLVGRGYLSGLRLFWYLFVGTHLGLCEATEGRLARASNAAVASGVVDSGTSLLIASILACSAAA